MKLARSFYARPTLEAAQALLGQILVHHSPQGATSGVIVETEAYLAQDPASHSVRGATPRNKSMFLPPGFSYIYRSYGIHWCFNISTFQEGIGEAVLVRAIQPIDGLDLMAERRGLDDPRLLCAGPGRLCQAFAFSGDLDGIDLLGDTLWLQPGPAPRELVTTTRIGISRGAELPYRFYIKDSPWISKP